MPIVIQASELHPTFVLMYVDDFITLGELNQSNPNLEYLCIIHDNMDHSKTTFPRFVVKNKMVLGLGQLPITLTGMITHGHGNEVSS